MAVTVMNGATIFLMVCVQFDSGRIVDFLISGQQIDLKAACNCQLGSNTSHSPRSIVLPVSELAKSSAGIC